MASFGQAQSRPRDAFQSAMTRLYKFAQVLTANEELARALLRSTCKALSIKNDFSSEDRDRHIGALGRMYAYWSEKLDGDQSLPSRCQPDLRLFAGAFSNRPAMGGSSFAKFMINLPLPQRASLYLVYGEGTSYDEAAEVVGLDLLSLMKMLTRGHVAMSHWLDRRDLSEEGEGDVSPGQERAA